jgi:hypothetical protein
MAMAEYDAAWSGEYGYDGERGSWWTEDGRRLFRFNIEPVALDVAA